MLTDSDEALAREVLIHGPIGRSALGRRLGLSPASLTRLAKPFLERGLFVELDEESTGSVGRPVRPLDIAPDLGSFAGVKLTGDALYAVLTDARARPLAEREVALDGITPEDVVAVLAEMHLGLLDARARPARRRRRQPRRRRRRCRPRHPCAVPGLDGRRPRARARSRDRRHHGHRRERPGRPRRGRALVRAGRGRTGFSVITIGAGVGYGLVVRGEAVHSREAGVGLGGHIPLDPTGPLCPAGHRGCSTAMLTSVGICAQVQAALRRPVDYDEVLSLSRRRATRRRRRSWMPRRAASAG